MAAVGRFLLIVALVASPWVFGCVQPWPQFLLACVIGGLTLLRAFEAVVTRPDRAIHLPLAGIAPLALLLISAVQLLPRETALPAQMQHAVNAQDAALFSGPEHFTSGTLSTSSTRRESARLYLALAAFLLATQWFADPSTHRTLFGALALNGAALGAFGIVQQLSWNGLLFWSVELRFGGTPFASYVNRNNAAGYLNLCLGAAIGLAILVWAKRLAGSRRMRKLADRIRFSLAQVDGGQLLVVALLIVIVASVLFSLSRGGVVAMVIGGLGVIFAAFRGADRRGLILICAFVLLAAVGLLVFSGQFETVDERMDSLGNPMQAASGRFQHWSDTFGAVRDFPLLGTGFGTYRYANQPYQQHPSHAWYYNADNEWFEILVEVGTVGCAAAAIGFLLIGACAVFLLRRDDPPSRAVGAAGLFVVLTQSIQALTDFGLIIPANGITFAVLTGTVCGAACRAAEFDRLRIPLSLSLARLDGRASQALLGVVLAIAGGAFLLELFTATNADAARDHRIVLDRETTRVAAVDAAIEQMEQVLKFRPDDGELHQALGILRTDRCRLAIYQQLLEAQPDVNEAQKRQFWNSAAGSALAVRARQLAATGQSAELTQLRGIPAVSEQLAPARIHFEQALRHCPLIRGSALWTSRLAFLGSDVNSSRNVGYLHKARFIAPSTVPVLMELAILADVSGESTFAEQCWRRRLEIAPEEALIVWNAALQHRTPSEVIASVLPDRIDVLVEIAENVSTERQQQELIDRAQRLVEERPTHASDLERGRLAELQSLPDVAIHHYRLALSDNPWDSIARLKLARLLNQQGQLSDAVIEYSLLTQQLPNRKDIQDELAALRLREQEELSRSRRSDKSDGQH